MKGTCFINGYHGNQLILGSLKDKSDVVINFIEKKI